MNRITTILFAFVLIFGCSQCDPNASKPGSDGPDITTGGVNPQKITKIDTANLKGHMKSVVGYDPDKPDKPEVNNFWWVDGYVTSREEVKAAHRGRWYRFYKDGTFEYGSFEKNVDVGTWKYDLANETLFTKTKDGVETMQWRSMMSSTRDKLVLVGPEVGPNRGDQMMLQPYLQKPTPKNVAW